MKLIVRLCEQEPPHQLYMHGGKKYTIAIGVERVGIRATVKGKQEGRHQRCARGAVGVVHVRKTQAIVAGFETGGRGHGPRSGGALQKLEKARNGSEPQRGRQPCPHLDFRSVRPRPPELLKSTFVLFYLSH